MCGILGEVNWSAQICREAFDERRDTLRHRGPDGSGTVLLAADHVALGHRRLAIIDLREQARQPFSNEDGTVWLTFNGEIYNHRVLREDLIQRGHRFRSKSDSEVIIHAYEEWGKTCLDRLRGMFAFAIWDSRGRSLLLARDRFGMKPLYYLNLGDRFLFASELKGIVTDRLVARELEPRAVIDYLLYRFVPSPKSIWKNIQKLPPAHILELRPAKPPLLERYWDLPCEHQTEDEGTVRERVEELLRESIDLHLVSDVEVGALLSGGLDSSTIVRLMVEQGVRPKTFCIGFAGDPRSEHQSARLVTDAFELTHTEQILESSDLNLELLSQLSWHFDEPLGGTSLLPTYLVSKLASHQVKVVMGGDGGDEVFAGYPRYYRFARELLHPSVRQWIRSLLARHDEKFTARRFAGMLTAPGFTLGELKSLLGSQLRNFVPSSRDAYFQEHLPADGHRSIKPMQYLDFLTYLPELYLTKVDRASMANSLEVRLPMLDHPLVEFMMRLDEKLYFRLETPKYLLHQINQNRLPQAILTRPKQGFSARPIFEWLDFSFVRQLLLNGRTIQEEIFQADGVRLLLENRELKKVFALLVFELWYREWK